MADDKEQEMKDRTAGDKFFASPNASEERDPLAELQRILSAEDPFKVFDAPKPNTHSSDSKYDISLQTEQQTTPLNFGLKHSNTVIEPIKLLKSHATPTVDSHVTTANNLGMRSQQPLPHNAPPNLENLEEQLKSLAKDIEKNFKTDEPVQQGELFSSLQIPSESIGLRGGIDSNLESDFEKHNATANQVSAPDIADTIRFFDENANTDKKPVLSTPIFAPLHVGGDDGIDKNRQRSFAPILSDDTVSTTSDSTKNSSFKILAAVAAVAVLGAGGLMLLNKSSGKITNSEPPIIRADEAAVKVKTENTDEIKISPNNIAQDPKLAVREEKPKSLDKLPSQQGSEPLKPSTHSPLTTSKEGGIQANTAAQIFGAPKKVKALIMGADGKLINPEEATNQPISEATAIAKTFDSAEPSNALSIMNGMRLPSARPLPVTSIKAETTLISTAEKKPEKKPEIKPTKPVEINMAALVQQVTTPKSSSANAPISLEDTPIKQTKSASYIVQLSAQRSEAAARSAFADLQKKHAALLGGKKATIVPIDLGERGTFYRVRLGGYTARDDAQNLCGKLKASGADCIVQPN